MSDAIGVLVVEREPLFRRGLVSVLKGARGIRVLDSVGTAEDGYRRADELMPTVALVGTTLPDAPGIAAAAELRRHFPALAIVVVAAAASDDELFAAIRAGAFAYVGKDVPERELVALVRRTATGEYVINEQLLAKPTVAARVIEQFREAAGDLAPARAFAPLTERELQILQGVADGRTNAQIGTVLGISGQTVKNHVTSILRKLAVNDRTQAVVLALRRGWLPVEIPTSAPTTGNGAQSAALPIADAVPTEPSPSAAEDGERETEIVGIDDPVAAGGAVGPDERQPEQTGAAEDLSGVEGGIDPTDEPSDGGTGQPTAPAPDRPGASRRGGRSRRPAARA